MKPTNEYLDARERVLLKQLTDVEIERARIAAFPIDNFEDGNVISFEKSYGSTTGKIYTYIALKANGRWWCSGSKRLIHAASWETLCEFMDHNEFEMPAIFVATSWGEI